MIVQGVFNFISSCYNQMSMLTMDQMATCTLRRFNILPPASLFKFSPPTLISVVSKRRGSGVLSPHYELKPGIHMVSPWAQLTVS